MLLFPVLFPEKNQPDEKQVDRQVNRFVFADIIPCLFHLFAPVYIVKNQYAVFV